MIFTTPMVKDITLNPAKIVGYPEARIDELKMLITDWSLVIPRGGATVERLNQVSVS